MGKKRRNKRRENKRGRTSLTAAEKDITPLTMARWEKEECPSCPSVGGCPREDINIALCLQEDLEDRRIITVRQPARRLLKSTLARLCNPRKIRNSNNNPKKHKEKSNLLRCGAVIYCSDPEEFAVCQQFQ